MPIHDSRRVEFRIESGFIQINSDEGRTVPAYWAHPVIGQKFSGICLLHDWWGTTHITRMLANFFAQMGYYVIAPDLFDGQNAHNPRQAMQLLEKTEKKRFPVVDATLDVLETHHRINKSVAAIGMGMGGSLAFEAAIKRDDLEAAVACSGFPQRYLRQFDTCNTPILAIYGEHEPYTKPVVIDALRDELTTTPLADQHRVEIIKGAAHDFFTREPDEAMRPISKQVINLTLAFLEQHLEQPRHQQRTRY